MHLYKYNHGPNPTELCGLINPTFEYHANGNAGRTSPSAPACIADGRSCATPALQLDRSDVDAFHAQESREPATHSQQAIRVRDHQHVYTYAPGLCALPGIPPGVVALLEQSVLCHADARNSQIYSSLGDIRTDRMRISTSTNLPASQTQTRLMQQHACNVYECPARTPSAAHRSFICYSSRCRRLCGPRAPAARQPDVCAHPMRLRAEWTVHPTRCAVVTHAEPRTYLIRGLGPQAHAH